MIAGIEYSKLSVNLKDLEPNKVNLLAKILFTEISSHNRNVFIKQNLNGYQLSLITDASFVPKDYKFDNTLQELYIVAKIKEWCDKGVPLKLILSESDLVDVRDEEIKTLKERIQELESKLSVSQFSWQEGGSSGSMNNIAEYSIIDNNKEEEDVSLNTSNNNSKCKSIPVSINNSSSSSSNSSSKGVSSSTSNIQSTPSKSKASKVKRVSISSATKTRASSSSPPLTSSKRNRTSIQPYNVSAEPVTKRVHSNSKQSTTITPTKHEVCALDFEDSDIEQHKRHNTKSATKKRQPERYITKEMTKSARWSAPFVPVNHHSNVEDEEEEEENHSKKLPTPSRKQKKSSSICSSEATAPYDPVLVAKLKRFRVLLENRNTTAAEGLECMSFINSILKQGKIACMCMRVDMLASCVVY